LTAAERLAAIYSDLAAAGLPCLVLGGHAVRYFGIDRNTVDYDFHVALPPSDWQRLPQTLAPLASIQSLEEGPSWRPADFRRFAVGTLEDGRPEYLECWRRNHLLAPFPELQERREVGPYGGRQVAFLGLADLIRSKETERESDWQDVALLEEIRDQRLAARAETHAARVTALASLRSRKGYEDAARRGWLADPPAVAAALHLSANPITRAFLTPSAAAVATLAAEPSGELAALIAPLTTTAPGTARHLALVEAVRRLYKREAMAVDRADKESALRT